VVLVTGCSSGIGLELAKKLRAENFRCIITARSSSLESLRENGFLDTDRLIVRPLDVTLAGEREAVIEEAGWRWGGVDILVNNAGISYRSVVEHMTEEEELHQLQTNYLAPMELIRLVLPSMRRKNWGRLINISSVGGMMAMPTMSSYSASKFALEGACEALWYELRPWNIQVSLIQPGFIHSDSFQHVIYSKRASTCDIQQDEYCAYYSAMAPFVEKLMNASKTTAADVASQVLRSIRARAPSLRLPATLDAKVFFWLRRMMPRYFYHRLLYWTLPIHVKRVSK